MDQKHLNNNNNKKVHMIHANMINKKYIYFEMIYIQILNNE